ncbi:hypothetical protein NKG05_04700 [Oerskovia sp. M15]
MMLAFAGPGQSPLFGCWGFQSSFMVRSSTTSPVCVRVTVMSTLDGGEEDVVPRQTGPVPVGGGEAGGASVVGAGAVGWSVRRGRRASRPPAPG